VADIEENLDYLIHRFGYRADSSVTDHGNVATAGSIRKLMTDATTSKLCVIFLPHHMKDGNTTDYRFQQDWDATTYTNCVLLIQPGARITIDNAVTVTWGGPVVAPHKLQWLSLTGTGAFTWIWNGLVWGNYDGTSTNAIHPTLDNTVDLGTSSLEFKDIFSDGTIHSDALDLGGNADALILDDDGDTTISADTDDQINFEVGGTDQIELVDGVLRPTTDDDVDIGASDKEFKDLYLDGTATVDVISCSGDCTVGGTTYTDDFMQMESTETAVGNGAQTLSAAELLGGFIKDDPEGAANWTTDTAANIVAAISGCKVGTTFRCILYNDATDASGEAVTLIGGDSVTLYCMHTDAGNPTLTEGTNEVAELIFRVTNVTAESEAVDCFVITHA
jgi:hypothetical protein